MSLYNLLHGVNPNSNLLKFILQIDVKEAPSLPKDCQGEWGKINHTESLGEYIEYCIKNNIYLSGRFRDIYLNEDGTKIILYTRNGGGNRGSYHYIFDIFRKHPNYIRDYDDDFDSTYAYIDFKVPEEFKDITKGMATGEKPETIHQKFEKTIDEMKNMSKEEFEKDERFSQLTKQLSPILDKLKKE
jgi:hypothetical protein